jgi:hypothetical protein
MDDSGVETKNSLTLGVYGVGVPVQCTISEVSAWDWETIFYRKAETDDPHMSQTYSTINTVILTLTFDL